MSIEDVRGDAATFVDKWRARWPEWEVASVFVPAEQRGLAEAWFALVQELTDAAWAGADPTPGLAKLAWWQEELGGWAKGARRHPLGQVLQAQRVPWLELGRSLPALRELRGAEQDAAAGNAGAPGTATAGAAFVAALAECEHALFGGRAVDAPARDAVLAALRGERSLVWHAAGEAGASGAESAEGSTTHVAHSVPRQLPRAGSRPRGVLAALVAGRLARPGEPLPPLRALFAAWGGARRAG